MFSFLKNHPFDVEAFFETSLVLTFGVSKEQLEHLIPKCLSLDTFDDEWAFIAVAMVQTKDLRPKGAPKIFGNDFFLIGYRVFVRFTTENGKSMRGLYILKSETSSRRMEFFGNIFTQYNYSTTDISRVEQNEMTEFRSIKSAFQIKIQDSHDANIPLPVGSPFANWKEARKFAGPLPFTFTFNEAQKTVLIIEGVRQNWSPTPVNVVDYDISFLNKLQLHDPKLANAFIIRNVPYLWRRGRIERWQP